MKRLFDFISAFLMLAVLLPLIFLIGLLVKVKLGSPVLFKQQRPGLHGKPFNLYKFRTMTNETDQFGHYLSDEVRLTAFGRFLRKYSLDELPQLMNVLKGELSFVGPRPLLMEYLPLYTEEQAKRHLVRPGITGWAQVNGRNTITWDEKFMFDVWYVNHHTFFLDVKIILLTIMKVIRSEGINQQGKATIERFKGSQSTMKEGHG